jgi:hypothetical protein
MQNASKLQHVTLSSALKGLLFAFGLLLASATIAQTYRGSLRGTVHDASGGILVGATVTAKSNSTGQTRTATTGSDGTYVIPELDAGEYDVTAQAKDLAQLTLKAIVEVGIDTPLDFSLSKVAGTSTQVTVTAATPLLEASQDVLGGIVEQRLVAELPLNGRDFGKLVALQPGVTVEGSGVAGMEKGFGQFNINGNRDRSNNYTLDGTDNNDPWFNNSALNQVGITGAPATLLPIDAIQEFNLQSQFPAEYGRNSGSVVNIITKSGTNQLHGSVFEYHRNSFFDARNFFNTTPNPQTLFINNQFGGSIGGPITRDRTFFFGAFEGQRERVGSDFIFHVPTSAERSDARTIARGINNTINTVPLDAILDFSFKGFLSATSSTLPGVVNDSNDLDNFIVKVDHKISPAHSFAARYAFGRNHQTFPFGSLGGFGAGSRLAPFAQISPTRVQVFSSSLLSTLSPTHINELRFGYSRFRNSFKSADGNIDPSATFGLNFGTNHTGLPEIDFNGPIENIGATGFSIPRARFSQSFQGLDNLTWIRGAHTWKFGGEFRRAVVNAFNDNLERGFIQFAATGNAADPVTDALVNYYLGSVCSFCSVSANTGNTQRTTTNNGFAFFAQDDYRIRPNLTLNYGLRWEYFGPISEKHDLLSNFGSSFGPTATLQMVGSGGLSGAYNRDLNNFGPRVAVAWNPWSRTVVRAGYGLYYDYIPQHLMIANFTTSAGIATNPTGPVPVKPLNYNQNAFNGSAPGAVFTNNAAPPFSIFVTDHNLRTPYVNSWNLNIQEQVTKAAVVEIGYVGSKGTKLTRLYDLNQDKTNSTYSTIDILSAGTSSTYHALQFNTRFNNWRRFSGFSAYTFSKSLDGASDAIDFNGATVAFPQNSDNLRAEKGPSSFDTRHRFTSALNYQVPVWGALPQKLAEGWQLNTVLTMQSGKPVPIITGGGINFHQRPDVVPGVDPVLHGSPADGYINPAAFSAPAGNFGNFGRNQVYGPGFKNVDFSVTKDTKLTETSALQFRAEFFNILNHPNFALPGGSFSPPVTLQNCSGCFSTATPDVAQGNPGLGGGGPRVLQFAVRLAF